MEIVYIIIAFCLGGGIVWLVSRRRKDDTDYSIPLAVHEEEVSVVKQQVEQLHKSLTEAQNETKRLQDETEKIEVRSREQLAEKEASLKVQYDAILNKIQEENRRLDSALKLAMDGKIDESVNNRLEAAEKAASVANKLELELEELRREHASLLSEHTPLKASFEEATSKCQALNKKVKQLEDEVEEAEEEQEELQKKLKNKSSELQQTQEELEKSSRDNKKLLADLQQRGHELAESIDQLKRKSSSIQFVQAILSAKESGVQDSKNLYKAIDSLESFLLGQYMDCNSFLFETYPDFTYNNANGKNGLNEKRTVITQQFNEWAAVKRKSWLDKKTTIAFVGEFSAGKTSIVNRILSQDDPKVPLLPVSTKATTAIPTYIAGGVGVSYTFVSPDGKRKNIDENIFRMVSKEVLDEIKGVSSLIQYFVMTYKNPNLNGLSILDTPGFNSNDSEDSRRTIEVINECDALFWVFDVNTGTVNRSSIRLIKENLNKPLIVVINKVDTKPSSEVDKVENLIRKTLSEEGLKVEKYIRFSSKAPLHDIMNPIKSISHDGSRDEFVSQIQSDIEKSLNMLDNWVKRANTNYQNCARRVKTIESNFYSGFRSLQSDCDTAKGIPHWEKHWEILGGNRYEMSSAEGNRLIELLGNISSSRCSYLGQCFKNEVAAVAEEQQAYSDMVDLKSSWQKVDECLKEFKRVTKNLSKYV